jgi:hypothetical protein
MKGSSMLFASERSKGPQSEAFWSEVESRIERGLPRSTAIEQTVANAPDIHAGMLAEANPNAYR